MEKTFLSIIVRLSQVDYFGAIEIVIFSKLLLKFFFKQPWPFVSVYAQNYQNLL